ncbi:hypothetical protein HK405_009735 [Cladochytrium tenue]|nr:hypothetical protein HK405_009735 [Cladochytrium tenue]
MYGHQPSPPFVQAKLQRTRSSGFQQVSPYGSPGMPAPQPPLPGVPFQSAASFTSPPPPLEDRSVAGSTAHPKSSGAPEAATFSFKLRHEASGKVFRFTASAAALDDLFTQILEKTGLRPATDRGNDSTVAADRIAYEDDDGDLVGLATDHDLIEAVAMARRAGWSRLLLHGGSPAPQQPPSVPLPPPLAVRSVPSPAASSAAAFADRAGAAPAAPEPGARQAAAADSDAAAVDGSSTVVASAPGLLDLLREAPMPVNVAISAAIVVLAAYAVSRLQRNS